MFTASSCLGEAMDPETFSRVEEFCLRLEHESDNGVYHDKQEYVGEVTLQDDSLNVGVSVYCEGNISGHPGTKTLWKDSGGMYSTSKIYSSNSTYRSLGLFGSSCEHGGAFTSADLCSDFYCSKGSNSYLFYGPELNSSYSMTRDVRFWAYYPKPKYANDSFVSEGFANNKPFIDYTTGSGTNADVDTCEELLYGSSSVIYGQMLGSVPITLNHALSAVWVCMSNDSSCDFGTIKNVYITGLYTSGRFYLDGSWTNLSGMGDYDYYCFRDDFDVSSHEASNTISGYRENGENYCFFFIPQTCPSGSSLVVEFDDGYSLRTMSASLSGLQFQMGKVYSLNINLDFNSDGYVHLDYPENYLHVPWQGGSYGFSYYDMDDWAVWCTCGNRIDFYASVSYNEGIVFSELNVYDGSDVEDYCDEDSDPYKDWFREDWSEDCSRLQMVIAPNLTSSSSKTARVLILCGDDYDHKPYELTVVQDGCPSPGGYYVTAKNIELPFNYNNAPSRNLSFSEIFSTNIPSSYYNTLSKAYNVSFSFGNSSDGKNYGLYKYYNYDYNTTPFSVTSTRVLAQYPNFSLNDVTIPYTVTVCGISSSANIILKAGSYVYRSLSLSPNPMELIYGSNSNGVGYKYLYCYFNYRISGESNTRSYSLPSFISSGSSNNPCAGFITVSNSNIAYFYSSHYMRQRAVGSTGVSVSFMELSASGTVNVVNPTISVSPSVKYVDVSGVNSSSFTVSSNTVWRMTGKPDWVTVNSIALNRNYSSGSRSGSITVGTNTGGPREGTITFQTATNYGTPQATVTLTVRQYGAGNIGLDSWNDGGTTPITW